jgi:hypothetical protein
VKNFIVTPIDGTMIDYNRKSIGLPFPIIKSYNRESFSKIGNKIFQFYIENVMLCINIYHKKESLLLLNYLLSLINAWRMTNFVHLCRIHVETRCVVNATNAPACSPCLIFSKCNGDNCQKSLDQQSHPNKS